MKEETYICAICGRKYPISQREEFDGQSLCPHCFTEETVRAQGLPHKRQCRDLAELQNPADFVKIHCTKSTK